MERVLMAVMGDHPHPLDGGTTHDRFAEIAGYAGAMLFIIPDLRNVIGDTQFGDPAWGPKHRTIHSMRLLASRLAKDGEYAWLFIVENDIDLPVDTLKRLLAHGKDVTLPKHEVLQWPFMTSMLYQPQPEEGQTGLHHIEWCSYQATLYRMEAFKGLDPMFVGGGEGTDYARWQNHGVEAWMDLDVRVVNLELPEVHRIIMEIPGRHRRHTDKSGELCKGGLQPKTAVKIEGALAAQCEECGYYIEYRPPKGYRGETLKELGLLGAGVD